MPSFGTRVTTTTQDYIMPKVVDTILNSNVFATRMLSRAKQWRGETIRIPIKYQKNTTGQSFAGFDTFSTSTTNNRVNLAYNPNFYQITVALPLDELSVNATDEKVLDLAAIETAASAQDAADDIGTMFYADGTGNSNKDMLGLAAIVDDGTSVSTIGGLSRTTYPTLASTVTASSGTLSLAKMSTLYNAITSGAQKPTLGLVTETVFALYEQLLQPQERIVKDVSMMKAGGNMGKVDNGYAGGTGFTGLFFKGFPILADEKCTSGVMFFVNEDFLDFYGLPMKNATPIKFKGQIEGNDYSDLMGLGFSWTDWIQPVNQAAVISHIFLGGNLITANPKRHGKLTGITSV